MNKFRKWLALAGLRAYYLMRRIRCKHFYMKVHECYGDEINHRNGARSVWCCVLCDKQATSSTLYDPPGKDK